MEYRKQSQDSSTHNVLLSLSLFLSLSLLLILSISSLSHNVDLALINW